MRRKVARQQRKTDLQVTKKSLSSTINILSDHAERLQRTKSDIQATRISGPSTVIAHVTLVQQKPTVLSK